MCRFRRKHSSPFLSWISHYVWNQIRNRFVEPTYTFPMLIELSNAIVSLPERDLLTEVNMHVSQGEFVYIIGKVGSGKSSLLKTLYAELPADGEKVEVLSCDLIRLKRKHIPALRRRMGIVFQDYQLLRDRTVADNLDFVLRATGWKKRAAREERIQKVLQQVGMADRLLAYPHELSGGEQQRVAIARALLNEPEIILADEPTGNLDRETSDHIIALLRSVCDQGTAVVVVTHNLSILQSHPGIVYLCKDGRVSEVTEQYNNPIVPLSDDVEQEVISIDAKE